MLKWEDLDPRTQRLILAKATLAQRLYDLPYRDGYSHLDPDGRGFTVVLGDWSVTYLGHIDRPTFDVRLNTSPFKNRVQWPDDMWTRCLDDLVAFETVAEDPVKAARIAIDVTKPVQSAQDERDRLRKKSVA